MGPKGVKRKAAAPKGPTPRAKKPKPNAPKKATKAAAGNKQQLSAPIIESDDEDDEEDEADEPSFPQLPEKPAAIAPKKGRRTNSTPNPATKSGLSKATPKAARSRSALKAETSQKSNETIVTVKKVASTSSKNLVCGKADLSHKSFIMERKAEGKVAAYCGYGNIREFRQFLLSFPVVRCYLAVQSLPGTFSWEHLYQEIRETHQEGVRESHIQDVFEKKYGFDVNLDVEYPILELSGTASNIEKQEFATNHPIHGAAAYWRALESLKTYKKWQGGKLTAETFKVHNQLIKKLKGISKLPTIDAPSIVLPELGPIEAFEEDYLSPYCRLFCVIAILVGFAGPSKYEQFLTKKQPFKSRNEDWQK